MVFLYIYTREYVTALFTIQRMYKRSVKKDKDNYSNYEILQRILNITTNLDLCDCNIFR